MNRATVATFATRLFVGGRGRNRRRGPIIAALVLAATVSATAQMGGAAGAGMLQDKMAAIKQAIAENKVKLHRYQWIETTEIVVRGEPRPSRQFMCQYRPDGIVQKTPIGDQQQQQPSGGRLRQRIIEKKTEEMKAYMEQVKNLLALYLPPDPAKMQQAFQTGNASLVPAPDEKEASIVFKGYAQPGDQLTLFFNTAAKKLTTVNVNTYMDDPQDKVTLTVDMASLPDGTNYARKTVLNATAKNIQVTTTSSNHQLIGAQ
jgi:hypothetical protein